MTTKRVTIHFENPELWQGQRENVDKILEEATGTSKYPSTRSYPPSIFGPELTEETIDKLNALDGVTVQIP